MINFYFSRKAKFNTFTPTSLSKSLLVPRLFVSLSSTSSLSVSAPAYLISQIILYSHQGQNKYS